MGMIVYARVVMARLNKPEIRITSGNLHFCYRISLRGNFNGKQEELEIGDYISYSIPNAFHAKVSALHASLQPLAAKN
jgi:hypothetical protein